MIDNRRIFVRNVDSKQSFEHKKGYIPKTDWYDDVLKLFCLCRTEGQKSRKNWMKFGCQSLASPPDWCITVQLPKTSQSWLTSTLSTREKGSTQKLQTSHQAQGNDVFFNFQLLPSFLSCLLCWWYENFHVTTTNYSFKL